MNKLMLKQYLLILYLHWVTTDESLEKVLEETVSNLPQNTLTNKSTLHAQGTINKSNLVYTNVIKFVNLVHDFKYCLLSAVHWIDVRLVFVGISKLASQHPQLIRDSVVNDGTALCRKDTGKGSKLRKWSRGHQFVIRGGGHIDTWQPLYKYVL